MSTVVSHKYAPPSRISPFCFFSPKSCWGIFIPRISLSHPRTRLILIPQSKYYLSHLALYRWSVYNEHRLPASTMDTPLFCSLSPITKRRGGLYVGCNNFSRDYALPSRHEVIVGGGWGPSAGRRQVRGGEMLTTLVVGWRALALRSEEAGRFHEVAGGGVYLRDTMVF